MRKKVLLFGIFCGAVGAILTMAVGLFAPISERRTELSDVAFGKVTCRETVKVDRIITSVLEWTPYSGGDKAYMSHGKDGDFV